MLVRDQQTLTLDFMLDCSLDLCLSVHREQRNAGYGSFGKVSFEALLAFSVGSFVLTEGPPVVQAGPEFTTFLPQPPECVMVGVSGKLYVKSCCQSCAAPWLWSSLSWCLPVSYWSRISEI